MSPDVGSFGYSQLLREIDDLRAEDGVTGIALVLLQLKGVGEVNRTLGYVATDKVLEIIAGRIAGIRRVRDRLIAINGSLFALLIRNPLHEGHAVLGAEKAIRLVAEPVPIAGERARVRARAGISLLPGRATTAEELLRQCELAIDDADFRDETHVVYKPALGAVESGNLEAWSDIDDALRRGEFEVYYQPKIALGTGKLIGAEALSRWRHPTRGLISPAQFMSVIEGTESVRTLLWHVLKAALRQGADWNQCWPGFRIAVNVSPTSLAEADLVELLADAIRIWNFPAGQLVLEVTESALMRGPAESTKRLHQLRQLGVQVSIDDFGTGYSSLAYLKNLPADELKIDKSFILPIAHGEADRRLVELIIELGHAVGLKVVAEGIEKVEQMHILAELGCDIGQGYLFSPALPEEDFQHQLATTGVKAFCVEPLSLLSESEDFVGEIDASLGQTRRKGAPSAAPA